MTTIDWLIVLFFLIFIIGLGLYSMRYVRGITDFLACGRVCGRYVLCVGSMSCSLAVVTLIGAVESGYKSGTAYGFWSTITQLVMMFLALSGFCFYRFRQTKAMSFGQFMEMRYSKGLRIFASTLRSVSEMLANMILPALAGRFFIYFLDLPKTFNVCGIQFSTFVVVMAICLGLAILMILFGGSVTLVITDTVQGLFAYPMLALFVGFVLWKFSWSNEVVPVMLDRIKGESFLNPYDVENLRDFNLFYLFVLLFSNIMNQGIGLGCGGSSSAAKSPHEQKMAGVLGAWRSGFMYIFFTVVVLAVIAFMNHINYAKEATECRQTLSAKVTQDLIKDPVLQQKIITKINMIPVHNHQIGLDQPLSVKNNLDIPYLQTFADTIKENPEAQLQGKIPEFTTLYHQQMVSVFLRKVLPPGMMGLFCVLVILMIISTDDSRIFSASLTLSQDLVLPLLKKIPTARQQIWIIRLVTIGVGIFFFCGSLFMSQLEYVDLFILIMYGLWAAGAGVVVLGGLYSRFGTSQGAWGALLSGAGTMIIGITIQRNWADYVYPWMENKGITVAIGEILSAISAPLNPYVVWTMNPYKCPINAVELSFIAMLFSIIIYFVVSLITCRHPFNLDRMLHRGKYNTDGTVENVFPWTWKNVFSKLIGITNEYTKSDKAIAWSVFIYTFGVRFCIFFLFVVGWNAFYKWPDKWWGNFYLFKAMIIPGIIAIISTFWFLIGGIIDLRKMFRDLKNRTIDDLDNGVVCGHVSLSDKKVFDQIKEVDSETNDRK